MPKLIYTQEFSDGLMLPNRDDTIDSLDDADCLAPLGKNRELCLKKIGRVHLKNTGCVLEYSFTKFLLHIQK